MYTFCQQHKSAQHIHIYHRNIAVRNPSHLAEMITRMYLGDLVEERAMATLKMVTAMAEL